MEIVIVFIRNELIYLAKINPVVEKLAGIFPARQFFSRLVLILLATVFVSVGCSDSQKASQTSQTDPALGTKETAPTTPPDTARVSGKVSSDNTPLTSTTWVYENRVEAVDEPVTHRASLTSPTRLNFGFPYTGGSTIRLSLRERNGDALLSLHVSNGAFNKSFQGGSVRIRFDSGPPVTYQYSAAQNGSATVIFLDHPDAIIRKLKASRKVIFDLNFYNQGNRQFVFQTADLRWPYPS